MLLLESLIEVDNPYKMEKLDDSTVDKTPVQYSDPFIQRFQYKLPMLSCIIIMNSDDCFPSIPN